MLSTAPLLLPLRALGFLKTGCVGKARFENPYVSPLVPTVGLPDFHRSIWTLSEVRFPGPSSDLRSQRSENQGSVY